MANELRRLYDSMGGLVEDNPLASGATTLTSGGLAALPAVGSTEHVPIVLDPDGIEGAPVIKYITAHTAAAPTATITAAGQEGTTARAISRDTPWVLAASVLDFRMLLRQGDSATDWSAGGTTTQALPATNKVLEQVGVHTYSGVANGGSVAVTFPVAFAFPPICMGIPGPTYVAHAGVWTNLVSITTTVVTFSIYNVAGTNGLGGTIHWRAIGEKA